MKRQAKQAPFFINALHIFVLFSFAVAQPLFDLLARNAEFFVTRHAMPGDVVVLVLFLSLLLPALVVLIEYAAGFVSKGIRTFLHVAALACLVSLTFMPLLKRIDAVPGLFLLTGASALGITFAVCYLFFHPLRFFVTLLSPALLVFPVLFLFHSPVSGIVFKENRAGSAYTKVDATAPVIFVVFDEFPITSLMDEQRRIDPLRYPGFASLAEDAYWFRNGTTVAESTMLAVPVILSGSEPTSSPRLPTAADYPHNIFTLLGGSYGMKVFESHTMLCPENLCRNRRTFSEAKKRIWSMFLDLSAVYLHIVVPDDLTEGFPVVTQTWKNFWGSSEPASSSRSEEALVKSPVMDDVLKKAYASYMDRSALFAEFVNSIEAADGPTLYFIHIMIPHVPWEYLPSGKRYTEFSWGLPGLNIEDELWEDDEWLVIQGYQRHLLQVGFADKLLGDLLERLKSLGLYDRSLIVVTADHGVSFTPGKSRRNVEHNDPLNILPVPLLIKAPHQREGVVSDRNVETIDILPTIADILDIPLPWPVDGQSAVDGSVPEREEKRIYNFENERFVFGADPATIYSQLKNKLILFGSGTVQDGIYKIGPYREIIGRQLSDITIGGRNDISVQMDQAPQFENVNPASSFIPALITGRVFQTRGQAETFNLALSVNGTVRAVTRTYRTGNEMKFSTLVPETAFSAGKNEVEVFTIANMNGRIHLARMASESGSIYRLAALGKRDERIISSDGTAITVDKDAFTGYVSVSEVEQSLVHFKGWAADIQNARIPETIVAFLDGRYFFSGKCNLERPDVVEAYGNEKLLNSGFRYSFPLSMFRGREPSDVRFFAVGKDAASELNYPGKQLGKNR